jgi:hypothetical protein
MPATTPIGRRTTVVRWVSLSPRSSCGAIIMRMVCSEQCGWRAFSESCAGRGRRRASGSSNAVPCHFIESMEICTWGFGRRPARPPRRVAPPLVRTPYTPDSRRESAPQCLKRLRPTSLAAREVQTIEVLTRHSRCASKLAARPAATDKSPVAAPRPPPPASACPARGRAAPRARP